MRLGHISKANIENAFEGGEPLFRVLRHSLESNRRIEGVFQTEDREGHVQDSACEPDLHYALAAF